MAPIALSSGIKKHKPQKIGDTRYEVMVCSYSTMALDEYEWYAKCDTLDEAAELAASLEKKYYVALRSNDKV